MNMEEADLEGKKRERIILAVQLLICVLYVCFRFWQEAAIVKKMLRKVCETQAKERIRYEKLKYRKKREALERESAGRRR